MSRPLLVVRMNAGLRHFCIGFTLQTQKPRPNFYTVTEYNLFTHKAALKNILHLSGVLFSGHLVNESPILTPLIALFLVYTTSWGKEKSLLIVPMCSPAVSLSAVKCCEGSMQKIFTPFLFFFFCGEHLCTVAESDANPAWRVNRNDKGKAAWSDSNYVLMVRKKTLTVQGNAAGRIYVYIFIYIKGGGSSHESM